MMTRTDPRLVRRPDVFTPATSLFSIAVGLPGILGWKFHVRILETWGASPAALKANAAACFVLLGISLWSLRRREKEQANIAKALSTSEDRFQTFADSIPQLAWAGDPAGNVVWYNQRWYEYTGAKIRADEGVGLAPGSRS